MDSAFCAIQCSCVFLVGSWALFMRPATWKKCKFNFKIGSHSTSHIFKNYFVIVFLVFNNKRYPNKPLVFTNQYIYLSYLIILDKNVYSFFLFLFFFFDLIECVSFWIWELCLFCKGNLFLNKEDEKSYYWMKFHFRGWFPQKKRNAYLLCCNSAICEVPQITHFEDASVSNIEWIMSS